MRPLLGACLSACLVLCGACTALPPPEPATHLDQRSGVTLTVVDKPLVFARERRDIAANVRDYITLVAVERDVAGKFTLALIAYRGSTTAESVNDESLAGNRKLVILAATLAYIAASEQLSAFYEDAEQPLSFALWSDQRDALARFARDRP